MEANGAGTKREPRGTERFTKSHPHTRITVMNG